MPKIEKDLLKVKGSDGQWHYVPAVGGSADTAPTWDSVQDKPFSTLGSGLSVDENGVLSAQGGGGGSANAVQYVAQTLTDEQKAQARENIGAKAATEKSAYIISKTRSYGYIHTNGMDFDGVYAQIQSGKVVMLLVDDSSTYYGVIHPASGTGVGKEIVFYNIADISDSGGRNKGIEYFGFTWHKGDDSLTEWFGDIPRVEVDSTLTKSGSAADAKAVGDALGTKLDEYQGAVNAGKILGIGEDGFIVPQDKPTYTLQQATADALGGIKADAATDEDTQVVRIGTDGKLKTKPTGGGSVTVDSELSSTSVNPVQNKVVTTALAGKITAPTTAAVGQIIKVKSVDGTGKPTEWEAADLPSGGAYTLPIASPTVLGGVKPIAKTDAMTQGVGVDEAGALWTAAEAGAYKILVNQTLEETAAVNITMTEEMAKCNEYIIHIVSPAGESNVNYNRYTTIAENDWLVNNIRIIDSAYGTVHDYHIVKVSTDHLWVDIYSVNTQSRTPGIDFAPRTNWVNNRRAYRSRNTPGVLYKSSVELLAGTIIVILGR